MERTDKRKEFLTDVLTGAIEHGGYGFFTTEEYRWDPDLGTPLGEAYAVIVDEEDERVFVEPLAADGTTLGPFDDEAAASVAMDEAGLSDATHKLVERAMRYRVDLDVIVKGLRVIRSAKLKVDPKFPDDEGVLHYGDQRLYVSPDQRRNIMLTDRTNGDDGDLDVLDYLAILECGLFGKVVYA